MWRGRDSQSPPQPAYCRQYSNPGCMTLPSTPDSMAWKPATPRPVRSARQLRSPPGSRAYRGTPSRPRQRRSGREAAKALPIIWRKIFGSSLFTYCVRWGCPLTQCRLILGNFRKGKVADFGISPFNRFEVWRGSGFGFSGVFRILRMNSQVKLLFLLLVS